MGAILSCCCSGSNERTESISRERPVGTPSTTPSHTTGHKVFTRTSTNRSFCDVCGAHIDSALLDGHQETCRANQRRNLLRKNAALLTDANLRPTTSCGQLSDSGSMADKELCLICLEHPRCYAFLPCGHISCCQECVKSLDQCPLCRQPREGLCYVSKDVISQYACKHCGELIAPTLFDGHREVCGLRQRQKHVEEVTALTMPQNPIAVPETDAHTCSVVISGGDEKTSMLKIGTPLSCSSADVAAVKESPCCATEKAAVPTNRVSAQSFSHTCLECGQRYNQLVVCVPCGHRVLCYGCSKKRTTCPVCLKEISNTVVAFV